MHFKLIISLLFLATAAAKPIGTQYLPPQPSTTEQPKSLTTPSSSLKTSTASNNGGKTKKARSSTTEIPNQQNISTTMKTNVANSKSAPLSTNEFSTAPNLVDKLLSEGILTCNDLNSAAIKTLNLAGASNIEGASDSSNNSAATPRLEIPIYENVAESSNVIKKKLKAAPKTTTTTTKTPLKSNSATTPNPKQSKSYSAHSTDKKKQILHTTVLNPAGKTPYSVEVFMVTPAKINSYLPPVQNVAASTPLETVSEPVSDSASTNDYSVDISTDQQSHSAAPILDIPLIDTSATNSFASSAENLDSTIIEAAPAKTNHVYADLETGPSERIDSTPEEDTKYAENGGYLYR